MRKQSIIDNGKKYKSFSFFSDKTRNRCLYRNLSQEERHDLFCKILYGNDYLKFPKQKTDEIKQFLKKIPSMPLDISTAAYYLKNTKASFEDYIIITEKFTEDFEKIQSKLLEASIH